jgi:DNA modification methylase
MSVSILVGDCRDRLRELPDASVHCCVTSPPYFGLRDYRMAGQRGLEATPEQYVAELAADFSEVRRVLRKEGTLWLVVGDSYAGSWGARGRGEATNAARPDLEAKHGTDCPARNGFPGIKPKDLIGIPWMLAFALRADGWWLRKDIIWNKSNAMPENVNDRPSSVHEYIFLLSKSRRYFYDSEAVKEDAVSDHPSGNGFKREARLTYQNSFGEGRGNSMQWQPTEKRNLRDVWTVPVRPYNEAHFATYPAELIEPCIKAGCPVGGTVLDPFGGAGTTGLVADRLQRSAILIELNPEYAAIAERRLHGDAGMFAQVEAA